MKVKKLLAGILSAAMVLGTVAVPVFAEESNELTFESVDVYCGPKYNDDKSKSSDVVSVTTTISSNIDVKANEFVAELYSNDILLATTTRTKDTTFTGSLSSCFYYTDNIEPESWLTTINTPWTNDTIPTGAKFYFKGTFIGEISFDPPGINQYQKLESTYKSILLNTSKFNTLISGNENGTVDLGGKAVLTDSAIEIGKDITIKNGTFDINGLILPNGNGIFDIVSGKNVTFENVTFTGKDYSSAYSVMFAQNDSVVTLNECTFNLENELKNSEDDTIEDIGGVLKSNSASGKFNINGGTYTLKNTVRCIADATVDIDGATIIATHTNTSTAHFFRNVFGTIKNSKISADNFQNGIKNNVGELTITNSEVSLTNMAEHDIYMVDTGSVLKTLSGKYSMDVSEYCESGYTAAKIGDMYEVLKKTTTEAVTDITNTEIGDKQTTLTEKIDASFGKEENTTSKSEVFSFSNISSAKVLRATYTINGKSINADIVVDGLEMEGNLTLGVILYNIPTDATVTGPEFSTLQ